MKNMARLYYDRVCFFIGVLTMELYWPRFFNTGSDVGFTAQTQLTYKKVSPLNDWWVTMAVVVKILGFGVGFAWRHCDNPNVERLTCKI